MPERGKYYTSIHALRSRPFSHLGSLAESGGGGGGISDATAVCGLFLPTSGCRTTRPKQVPALAL